MASTCSVGTCDTPPTARGFCDKHYRRWKKWGDPEYVKPHRERAGLGLAATRIDYRNCAHARCGTLFVVRSWEPRRYCSRACGLGDRAPQRLTADERQAAAGDATTLCAWWLSPYCERDAGDLDLCDGHRRRAHQLDQAPPTFARVALTRHDIVRVGPDGSAGECTLCGPGVAVRRYQKRDGYMVCAYGQVARNRQVISGWSEVDYDDAVVRQGNRCAICTGPPTGKSDRLYADHDHATMGRRELLCSGCNTALGMMKDDPATLERAARYLRAHRGSVAQSS